MTDRAKAEKRILIVEDEGIVGADIKATLERYGYHVCSIAATGEEAIRKCEEERPDLVLMDIMLAGQMDGIESADRIRKLCDIPVIYLTAYSDETLLERAKKTEPFGYLIKPFSDRELHTSIEMAVHNHMTARRLRETEAWLGTTLRSIGDGVIATDPEGKVRFMNPVAQGLTGWKEEDARGKPLQEVVRLISEETGREESLPLRKVMEEGRSARISTHILKKNGEMLCISDSMAPILDAENRRLGVVLTFSDITGKRLAEEQVRQSEERCRLLFDLLPFGGEVLDADGRIVDCSVSNFELLGYDRAEMINRHITEFLLPEMKVLFAEKFPLLKQGRSVQAVVRMVRKDGKVIDVERAARPLFDAEGRFSGVLALNVDITERRRLESALKKSEERMRSIVDALPLPVAITRMSDGGILFVNGLLSEMVGLSADSLLKAKATDFYGNPAVRQLLLDAIVRNGYVNNHELEVRKADGARFWVLVTMRPLIFSGEKAVITMFNNVTERKMLLNELRRYEHIVSSSSEHMSFLGRDYVYRTVNEAYLKAHGKERANIIGRSVADLLGPEVFEGVVKGRLDRCLGGEEVHYEDWFDFPVLGRRFMDVQYYPFRGPEGTVEGIVVVSRDITERRMLEDALKRYNVELEEQVRVRTAQLEAAVTAADAANRAKSEFLANMSHELRTPLNSILGFAGVIRDRMAGPVTDNQKEFLDDILESGARLLQMIDDILKLSQLDTEGAALQVREFSLKVLVEGVMNVFWDKATRKNIRLTWDLPNAGAIGPVSADELKVRQVLYNLVENAIKFTPEGGSVRVSARSITEDGKIRSYEDREMVPASQSPDSPVFGGNFIEISVEDTGIGISPDDEKKLFMPFSQADQSSTKKYGGAGLGLSLCRKIVELHGGRIWVESEPGKGSTFTFIIPSHVRAGTPPSMDQYMKVASFRTLSRHADRIISFHRRERKNLGILRLRAGRTVTGRDYAAFEELLIRGRRAHELLTHAEEEGVYYLLMMGSDRPMMKNAAVRITHLLGEEGYTVSVTAAVFPDDGDSFDSLLRALKRKNHEGGRNG